MALPREDRYRSELNQLRQLPTPSPEPEAADVAVPADEYEAARFLNAARGPVGEVDESVDAESDESEQDASAEAQEAAVAQLAGIAQQAQAAGQGARTDNPAFTKLRIFISRLMIQLVVWSPATLFQSMHLFMALLFIGFILRSIGIPIIPSVGEITPNLLGARLPKHLKDASKPVMRIGEGAVILTKWGLALLLDLLAFFLLYVAWWVNVHKLEALWLALWEGPALLLKALF